MVAVGQIWEYRKDPGRQWKVPNEFLYKRDAIYYTKTAWQIVGGEIRGQDAFWTAKVVRDEDGFLGKSTHTFSEGVFIAQERFRMIYDPAQDHGAYCGRCGKLYPYANWKPDFRCWGCRNGF